MRSGGFLMKIQSVVLATVVALVFILNPGTLPAEKPMSVPRAFIDGTGPGWRQLGAEDLVNVNCAPDTWTWKGDQLSCTGRPVGVCRTKKPVTNFELVAEWRHL